MFLQFSDGFQQINVETTVSTTKTIIHSSSVLTATPTNSPVHPVHVTPDTTICMWNSHYYYRDFCDVNLVDYGAGIPHAYAHHDAGYGYGLGDAHANGYSADAQAKGYISDAHATAYSPRF